MTRVIILSISSSVGLANELMATHLRASCGLKNRFNDPLMLGKS